MGLEIEEATKEYNGEQRSMKTTEGALCKEEVSSHVTGGCEVR